MKISIQKALLTFMVWVCCVYILGLHNTQAQQITKLEYFFNQDPDYGKGTNVPVTPGEDVIKTFQINVTPLSPGFHQFYLRSKNASGQWSMTTMRIFYKESFETAVSEGQLSNVTKGEFFFDKDPGFSKGTNIPLTAGQDLSNVTLAADITSLSPGFHQLYLRFKNANGQWSMTTMRTFYKESLITTGEASNVKITKGEYYIDSDPGFGKGVNIPFTPSTDLTNLAFTLNMVQISVGNHKLYVRFQDENGNWSATSANDFKVESPSELVVAVGDIAGPLCANSTVAVPFTVNSSFGSNNIFTAELSDANGSFTNAVAIGTLAGTSSGTVDALIPANTPAGTNYRIRVTASSPAKTSEANSTALTINRLPENFSISGAGATCLGFQTYTTNLAAQDETTYTWEVTGGGAVNPNGNTATVNWTSAGTYTVKVVASNSCGNSVERVMTVTVNDAAPALAPTVTTNGRWMYASTAPSNTGVASYQWYVNGGAVSGATSSSYYAYDKGDYTVKYKNACGEGPVSNLITFSGTKQNQTITFNAIPDKTYGDEPFALNATASSGLTVAYTITEGPATVTGNTLTITGGGAVTVQATQAGNENYNATSASQSFTVNKANAAIALAKVTQVYDGTAKAPTATTTPAGLPISFTYNGSSTAPVNAGTYDVVATISSSNYQGATTGKFIIEKAAQTIVLESVPDKAFGDAPFNITAAAVSGLPVSLRIETVPEGIATLNGATVTILGAGTVTVTATQGGSSNYAAAPDISDSFTINKASQRISFAEIPDKTFGDEPFELSATSSSGLPVLFSVLSGPATIKGNTVSLTGTGTVTVWAAQAGNANYLSAADLERSFNVNTAAKQSQTIMFAALTDKTFGDGPVALSATASSGLPVSFNVVDGPAKINGSTLTITGAGTVTVRASQSGNDTYNAAAVEGSFSVSKADQRISFLTIEGKTYGDGAFNVTATSTSGLPVSFSIASGPATVSGNTVTITGAGTVEIVASQNGDTNYNAAPSVSQSIPVGKAAQSITFAAIPDKVLGDASFKVSAESSSGLPVSFSIRSGPATISGNTITLTGLGTVEVTATQEGNDNSLAASVSQRFNVLESIAPSLSITKLPADATEGGAVTFTVTTNLVTSKPLEVFLTSNSQSRFPVPPLVTIPAGSLSADVTVSLEQDDIPEIDIEVNIMAGAANHEAASAILVVKDDDVPGLELIVHTSTVSESGGAFATQATLRRVGQSSSTAFSVNLSANLASALILPASISLAAGENEKTFTIGVVDNSEAEGDREVTITASVYVNSCSCSAPPASSGSVEATLTVTDNDGPALSLSASQLTLLEGFANAGQLRISRNTPSDVALTVNLSSSNENEATVPATVTIPAGQAFVEVPITTISDGTTDGSKQVYFHATAKGYSTGAVWVMVSDQNLADLQIPAVSISSANVQAGELFNYRLSVNNSGFVTAPAGIIIRGYLSKDDMLDAADTEISEDVITVSIPAGEVVRVQNVVKVPDLPGDFKLLYRVNPESSTTELLTTNNTASPVALKVLPSYTATAHVSSEYFLKGQSITITGSATRSDGTKATNVKVEVYVVTNGIRRTMATTTDQSGSYSTEFIPLAAEAGYYTVGASFPGMGATKEQDNFDILGVRINNGQLPHLLVTLGDTLKGSFAVMNMSSRSLANFTLEPVSLPNGAKISFGKVEVLAGNASINLSYTVIGSALSAGINYQVVDLKAISAEGVIQHQKLDYYCQTPKAHLIADIDKLDVSVSVSKGERLVEIKIVNIGKGSSGSLTVSLPQVSWLSNVTPKTFPALADGDTAVVVLKFLSMEEVPFDYPVKGNIVVNAQKGNSLSIPFTFEKKAESAGLLKVTVTNQFTYFTQGAPKVQGARVQVRNYFTGVLYADGISDATGVFTATDVPEGKHRIIVEKEQHQPYGGTVVINPGGTTEASVFLNYQAITFNWSVVPTAVEDQYDIALVAKFETHVPMPVVTVEMPKIFPQLSGSETYAFNVILTNHGLITANDVTLTLPENDAEYEFITNYVTSDLQAQQSIQVPALMRRRTVPLDAALQRVNPQGATMQFLGIAEATYAPMGLDGDISCTLMGIATFWYNCGTRPIDGFGAAMASVNGRQCDFAVFQWFPNLVGDLGRYAAGGSGGIVGGYASLANGGGAYIGPVIFLYDKRNCTPAMPPLDPEVLGFSRTQELSGGYAYSVNQRIEGANSEKTALSQNNAVAKAKESRSAEGLYKQTSLNQVMAEESDAVCASVKVQLSQQLTMTREAFEGTLDIFNGHPTDAMDSLSVHIQVKDENGVPSNGLFEIQNKSLTNLSDVTGTGAIGSQQNGTVKFLFIPELGAAPTEPKEYKFGGYVRYWDPYAQGIVTMPLAAVPLTVNPSPNLMLHYFMERHILGDDALTKDVIEPTIPAELAVMVENLGYGPAVNMVISSAQPKIIENEKGLAINFNIIGANFQGKPKNLGVTDINFGTIPALQTRIGQWYFTSSLLGKFVSYEAKVLHANSFGNSELSLVKGIKLHELTKSIRAYGSAEDGINDFLVNDTADAQNVPDIIYFSQGNHTANVYPAKEGSFSSPVAAPSFTNTLTVTASNKGWNYIKLDDPGNKLYDLVSVTRSDGQVIPLDNAWLTFVTLPVSRPPVYENKFHFVDEFVSLNPVSYTVVWKPRNLDVPEIVSIEGITEPVTASQVQNLTVMFNKAIDPATFTFDDLNLTFQGGPNIINKEVAITQLDASTFKIDVSALTTGNGFYNLTVQAANVQDIHGISGLVGKQVTWSQFLTVPAVQAFYGVPEGNMASSFDAIQVLFNLPIDEATATPERFYILKDSVLQSRSLAIDSVRADKKLFYLSGLKNILTADGTYTLVVDLPKIQSVDQVPGMKEQSVELIVDNRGPQVLSLEKSNTGGLDPQHVTFVNIRFNEDVKGFNTASVRLTRNGEVQLLSIAQLSNTDLKNWTAGNFGLLTYPEGEYTFTVNSAGFTDAMGNTGAGTQEISWTVNRSAVVTVSDLALRPDLGFSDSDGVTSGQSVEVFFNLSHNASKVTISQVDLSGEVVLTSLSNVAAGAVTVRVTLQAGGNTGIKVTATGANGSEGTAERHFFVDQVQLAAEWLFEPDQILKTQVENLSVSFNSRILSDEGFLNAIQFKKDGAAVSTEGLSFEMLNETTYSVKGIRDASSLPGKYQLSLNLQAFSKHSSGLGGTGSASVFWTVQSTNVAPVAKAGKDMTITTAGIVVLDGSLSADPDADQITYHWIAPEGIVLSDSLAAKPSFSVTSSDHGKTYTFLLMVRDGSLFSTDAVNVTVDLLDLGIEVPQSITFKAIPNKVYGDAPFELEAISTSGLPVSFRIVSGSASISGSTLTIRKPGDITVEASQKGNTTYNPATPVIQRFTVSRAPQRIDFAAIPDQIYGVPPLQMEATSTSGLEVKLSVLQGPAKISGGRLTLTGLGQVRVQASQWGNGNYAPASPVTHTFNVAGAVADVASSTTWLQVGAETGMVAYPNPFSSKTKVSFVLPEGGAYVISLFDTKGALVKTVYQGRANAGERTEVEVSAEGLVNGTYLLRLSSQKSSQTLRLLLNK